MITYQEYRRFTIFNAFFFPLGMAITLAGLYMLIGRKASLYRPPTHPRVQPRARHALNLTRIRTLCSLT